MSRRESEEDTKHGVRNDSEVLACVVVLFTEMRKSKFREEMQEFVFGCAY